MDLENADDITASEIMSRKRDPEYGELAADLSR
jgi:hypothetical protein